MKKIKLKALTKKYKNTKLKYFLLKNIKFYRKTL